MSDVTQILERVGKGDGKAADELLPLVYEELRKLAAAKMSQEKPGQTLQATALVHEAWIRLVSKDGQARFENRAHFFGAAAEAMRRILVEQARRKKRLKRGGAWERVELTNTNLRAPMPDDDLLALDSALDRLAKTDPRGADIVKLCFFLGLTQEQAAKEMNISVSTVERGWAFARAWLFREIKKG